MRARTTLSTARIPSTLAVVAILALCIAGCTRRPGTSGGAAAVPAPATPPSDDILAYIAIGSLDAAIERSADVARTLQPKNTERVTPELLKAKLGAGLQDPELKFLDTTKPIVVALLKGGAGPIPPVVALLPAKEGAPYAQMLSQMQMHTQTVGGLLAVAQTPDALASAPKVKALHDKVAGEKGMKIARVYLDAEGLLAAYGGMLKAGIEQVTRNVEAAGAMTGQSEGQTRFAAKILQLEFLALHSMLAQSDSIQAELDWGKKGFDVDTVLAARPGTELAAFFSASGAGQAPERSLVKSVGTMRGSFFVDTAALDRLAGRLIQEMEKDPAAAGLITPDVSALLTSTKDCWKGSGAMSVDFSGKSLSYQYEMAVHSEEKLLELMEKMGKLFAQGTAVGDFYKALGLEPAWSIQKSAREHAKVPVHRFENTVKFSESGPAAARPELEAMKAFLEQKVELAIVGDRALLSGAPSELDGMIDRALAKDAGDPFLPAAAQVFGKGRQIYIDYDILGLFKAMAAMNPNDPGAEVMQRLSRTPSVEPMTYAVTFGEGRSLFQMRLPMAMIENVVKASQDAAEAEAGR